MLGRLAEIAAGDANTDLTAFAEFGKCAKAVRDIQRIVKVRHHDRGAELNRDASRNSDRSDEDERGDGDEADSSSGRSRRSTAARLRSAQHKAKAKAAARTSATASRPAKNGTVTPESGATSVVMLK